LNQFQAMNVWLEIYAVGERKDSYFFVNEKF